MRRVLRFGIILLAFLAIAESGCDTEESQDNYDNEKDDVQSSDRDITETDSDGSLKDSASGVCAGKDMEPGRRVLDLQHGETLREYILYVPESLDREQPNPLVFNFHGYTSNMRQQEFFSDMNKDAEKNGFILVYPNGLVNEIDGASSWNAGGCCAYGEELTRDDVGFVRRLLEELEEKMCIDPSRVYAAGMSNGGFMSHYLACEAADIIAAIAPVAGVMAMSPSYCTPSRPVPVIHFHGTADSVVPYGNEGDDVYLTSVEQTIQGWAAIDGCDNVRQKGYVNGKAHCESYTQCQAGVEVTLCTINGMEHCWPGQAFCPYSSPSLDISANDAMWEFFTRFKLPNPS